MIFSYPHEIVLTFSSTMTVFLRISTLYANDSPLWIDVPPEYLQMYLGYLGHAAAGSFDHRYQGNLRRSEVKSASSRHDSVRSARMLRSEV